MREDEFLEWCLLHKISGWTIQTCDPHDEWKVRHMVLWIYRHEPEMESECEGVDLHELRLKTTTAFEEGRYK